MIAERLCPFAGAPWRAGEVRLCEEAGDSARALERLAAEAETLSMLPSSSDATALIVLTHPAFSDFEDYLDLVALGDELLDALDLRGCVQLASFHPDYRFEGEPPDDPANWTNRSPWPVLHLLREQSVERAVEACADPDEIPARNVAHLRTLGAAEARRRATAASPAAAPPEDNAR